MSAVYALAEPETLAIRYVGMTTRDDVGKRLREHLWPSAKRRAHQPVYSWLQTLSGPPVVFVLDENPTDPHGSERFWIALLRAVGTNLLNANAGGGGTARVTA